MNRGFDRSFVCIDGAMNYFGHDPKGRPAPLKLDDQAFIPPEQGFYSTDAFTDHAIEFVEEARTRSQPFFLYLAFNAPHWPLQALTQDIENYRGKYAAGWQAIRKARHAKQIELGLFPADSPIAPMDRGATEPWNQLSDAQRAEWGLRMAVYAAQVDRMDQNIGRLLDALARLNIDDNTLVMFISDNGGAAEDPNRSEPGAQTGTRNSFVGYARPWATVSNTPLRLHKSTVHEGGISAPCIIRWPAVIKPDRHNTLVSTPAHLIDLMPTCLDIAKANPPARPLEGVSLAPLLRKDESPAPRLLFWEHEGNRAVRDGKWKLVQHFGTPWELYDLDADRTESHDLSAQNPQLVETLKQHYDTWARRCGVLPWENLSATRPSR